MVMKKTLSLLILISLFIPMVYADFEITEGLEITKIRVEIDGDEIDDYDYDDEDYIEEEDIYIDVGSDLMIRIDFDNTFTEDMELRTEGILENIDDGGDISSTSNWYEIKEDDDLTRSWGAEIPSDAEEGRYDLEITIYYRYTESNTTEYTYPIKLTYDIHVGEGTEKYEEGGVYNLTKTLINTITILANNCSLGQQTADCFEGWGICKGSLEGKNTQIGDKNKQISSYQNRSTYYETKFNELQKDTGIMDILEGEKRVCQTSLQECQSKTDNNKVYYVIMLAVGGVVGYVFAKKKEKPPGMEQDREGGY